LSCPAVIEISILPKTRREAWTTIGALPLATEVAVDLLRLVEEVGDVEADLAAFRDLDPRLIEGDQEMEDADDLLPEEDLAGDLAVTADLGAARPHLVEDATTETETGAEMITITTGEDLQEATGVDLPMTTVVDGVAMTTVAVTTTGLPEEGLADAHLLAMIPITTNMDLRGHGVIQMDLPAEGVVHRQTFVAAAVAEIATEGTKTLREFHYWFATLDRKLLTTISPKHLDASVTFVMCTFRETTTHSKLKGLLLSNTRIPSRLVRHAMKWTASI